LALRPSGNPIPGNHTYVPDSLDNSPDLIDGDAQPCCLSPFVEAGNRASVVVLACPLQQLQEDVKYIAWPGRDAVCNPEELRIIESFVVQLEPSNLGHGRPLPAHMSRKLHEKVLYTVERGTFLSPM
jgi:hypothetical protein